MIRAATLTLLLALPAAAQDPAARVAAILDTAMTEARVQLTCTSLERESHAVLTENWQTSVAETLQFLATRGVAPANLAAFTASALPGALLPAPDTPFSEVKAFCDSHPDWLRDLRAFRGTFLPGDVKKVFDE